MENKPKIVAKTLEEFQKIEEKLKTLPKSVYSQIEIVNHSLVGLECNFQKTYGSDSKMYLPKDTKQITDFGDYIGVYSGDFFFKIPKENKIDFVFIE